MIAEYLNVALLLLVSAVVVYGAYEDNEKFFLRHDLSWVIILSSLIITIVNGLYVIAVLFFVSLAFSLRKSSASRIDKRYMSSTIAFDFLLLYASGLTATAHIVRVGLIFIGAYMVYVLDKKNDIIIPALVPLGIAQTLFAAYYLIMVF